MSMIADGKNRFLMSGTNSDIVRCWEQVYEDYKHQPIEVVENLGIRGIGRAASVDQKCQKIFDYMVKHTYYRLDEDGEQLIKTPARLIEDGCGDCKSYTMFIASCLYCLGIPCIVRFVNFDGGSQYTHVYPVAIDEQGHEIVMDACEEDEHGVIKYGFARPYAKKKDLYYGK